MSTDHVGAGGDIAQQTSAKPSAEPPESETATKTADPQLTQREVDQAAIKGIDDRVRSAEKWMIWLTAAIAVFALGSVIVAGLQWNVMSGQLKEMKSSGDDSKKLVEASGKQATAAEKSAVAAQAFSSSALDMASGIQEAVTKLNVQAAATGEVANAARSQAEASIVIAQNASVQANAMQTMAAQSAESVRLTLQQLVVSQRPWMRVSLSVKEPLVVDALFLRAVIHITATNLGHYPAMKVTPTLKLWVRSGITNPEEIQKAMCADVASGPLSWGETVLPGDSYESNQGVSILRTDIGRGDAYVIGGLDYVIDYSNAHHQTMFLYQWYSAHEEQFDKTPDPSNLTFRKVPDFGNTAN